MADWKTKPLYVTLVEYLPAFVTTTARPGQDADRSIDVQKLRLALSPQRSHEAVYKWFRKGTLKPENARDLCIVAASEENAAALAALGKTPPTLSDMLNLTLVIA